MSRTNKSEKGCGFEFWKSRYAPHGDGRGVFYKKITHKRERKKAKNLIDTDMVYLLRY